MDIFHTLLDYLIHFEVHLDFVIKNYHSWTYLILFLIIFIETGCIILPFLPGDSLLFAIGAISARGSFDLVSISTTLVAAAILGDTLNYSIGKFIGPKIFAKADSSSLLFKKENLDHAHRFYENYGAKTIILARFIPIVRTFAPFVAGIGKMSYRKFMSYNILGALLWVCSFIALGYFFGNLPIVQKNFKIVMIAIIIFSVLPGLIEFLKSKYLQKMAKL